MRILRLVVALAVALPLFAQGGYEAFEKGEALMKEGKPSEALPLYVRAVEAYPRHTLMLSGLARAAASAGNQERALDALEAFARLGGVADLAAEPLSKIVPSLRRDSLAAKFRESATPINASRVVATIPERELVPESIAFDARDGAYYVGSLYLRKIVKVSADGKVTDFVPPAADGIWSVLGMKIDPARRELWANACNVGKDQPMKQPDATTEGRGGVWRYSLDTGKLVRRYLPEAKVCFNDLAFARGRVWMTTGSDGIWSIDPEVHTIAQAAAARDLWANGIASDERGAIYVADALSGVMRFDPDARTFTLLGMPEGVSLGGIDGLYVWRGRLVGIQNALRGVPPRVIIASLDESRTRVESMTVLERAHPLHDIPTCGVVSGDRLVYLANSQLRAFSDGKIRASEKLQPTYLLGLDLPATREDDRRALREIHEKVVKAHVETNVGAILENQGDRFVTASNGAISTMTKAEIEAFFTRYFRGAKYHEYTTLEEPVIHVSDDGSMAWVMVRTRVRRTQTIDGVAKDRNFVYAGVMMYEKRDGVWKGVGNVSTFEP
ncbi:MAG: hypothetical protein WC538_09965 [Thermoanaerobaculia bacterium]|jgi:hypothetical protein